MSGAFSSVPASAIAITASALGMALAVSVVPSSGSSAMSTLMPPDADLLADEQHRGFVALALADHHRAVDGQEIEGPAHGFDGGLVGGVLVAAADQARGSDGGGLGHAHGFQRKNSVQGSGHAIR